MRRALVIVNPIAGRGTARRRLAEIEGGLRHRGIPTEAALTSKAGDARDAASRAHEHDLVVVIGGELVACEAGELLAEKGKKVTLCDIPAGGGQLAASMEITSKMAYKKLMAEKGIRLPLIPNIQFKEITDQGVTVVHSDGREQFVEADTVVVAAGYLPNDGLYKALAGKTWDPPYVIGDCAKGGRIYDAIHDGARVGRTL